jgi:MFS family permease
MLTNKRGLSVGASSLIVPQYIAEWSPPAIRGRLVGIFEMVLQVSQIIGFWVNYGVNEHISASSDAQWRAPLVCSLSLELC